MIVIYDHPSPFLSPSFPLWTTLVLWPVGPQLFPTALQCWTPLSRVLLEQEFILWTSSGLGPALLSQDPSVVTHQHVSFLWGCICITIATPRDTHTLWSQGGKEVWQRALLRTELGPFLTKHLGSSQLKKAWRKPRALLSVLSFNKYLSSFCEGQDGAPWGEGQRCWIQQLPWVQILTSPLRATWC